MRLFLQEQKHDLRVQHARTHTRVHMHIHVCAHTDVHTYTCTREPQQEKGERPWPPSPGPPPAHSSRDTACSPEAPPPQMLPVHSTPVCTVCVLFPSCLMITLLETGLTLFNSQLS